MPDFSRLLSELRRRNVLKAGGAYLAGAWLLVQLAATVLPVLGAPDWVLRVLLFVLAVGLPLMLAFAWAFELTPEGLKRTEEVDPARSQTKETGRRIQYLIIGLLGLAVVVLAADRFAGGEAAPPPGAAASQAAAVPTAALPDGTAAVAVMPFTTSGPETDVWREGMVSLLTTNLDGMGRLRAIDKRTVLARWRERVPEGGTADLATTLDAARAAQASVAVVGDVIAVGETMRISAAVHDTETGATLGRLQAEGDADDFMALIDQLTVQAVEAARRGGEAGSGEALPVPDVSALTTTSLPALRAYLDGERLYRQSRFGQAVGPLERAVQLDSTFAMAHLRLADAYVYTYPGAISDQVAAQAAVRRHLRAADRHGSRLPPRETAILESGMAAVIEADRPKSADLLQVAVQRFPTDPELWSSYGRALSNPIVARHVGAAPTSGMQQAARRALALDSTMTPAYIGLIVPAIAEGDTAEARRLLAAYARHAGAGAASRTMDSYEAALDLAHGDSTAQAATLQALRAGTLRGNVVLIALGINPGAEALRALGQLGRVFSEQNGFYSVRTQAWLWSGQYDNLRAFVQDTTLTSRSARNNRLWAATTLVGRGALPAAAVPGRLTQDACQPEAEGYYRLWGCYRLARLSMQRQQAGGPGDPAVPGDPARQVEAARATLRASTAAFEAAGEPELAQAARGYLGLLSGMEMLEQGTPAAHDTLDAAYRNVARIVFDLGEWAPMEAQIRALITGGEITGDAAERALEYAAVVATRDPYGHYLAGRAHEAAGNAEAARASYAQFTNAWRDADPEIPALQHAQSVLDGDASAAAPPL